MIIFDDKEFVKQLEKGQVKKNKYSNNVLRSCARLVNVGEYEYEEMYQILSEHTNFDLDLLWSYVENNSEPLLYTPHSVVFYNEELRLCATLKKKAEQKIYLYLLFLFKYFKTKKIKVSLREIKILAGIQNQHKWNLKNINLGLHLTARREKTQTCELVKEPRNHKIYWYYYPKKYKKIAFKFIYKGDTYLLSSQNFNSNLNELWELFENYKKQHGVK